MAEDLALGGRGDSHLKVTEMLFEKLKLDP